MDKKAHVWIKCIYGVIIAIIGLECLTTKKIVFGSNASLNKIEAINGAINEAYAHLKSLDSLSREKIIRNFIDINSPYDHMLYYANLNNKRKLQKYLDLKCDNKYYDLLSEVTYNDIIKKLENAKIKIFKINKETNLSKSLELYVYQLFSPDLPYLSFTMSNMLIPKHLKDNDFFLETPHPFG